MSNNDGLFTGMHDLLKAFKDYIHNETLCSASDVLLLAVSGGMDSVTLCELCYRSGFPFVIAHCNFQLRGLESERDEGFVQELARKYDKPFLVKRFETAAYAAENKVSTQVAARELRYKWFASLLTSPQQISITQPATLLATAHHADDNVETVLMNLLKGTGIAGLRGILPRQQNIIRPLLFAQRAQIAAYVEAQQLVYVEDSSNETLKYTRNYVRHQLLPEMQKLVPAANINIHHTIERLREVEQLYLEAVNTHRKKLLEYKGSEVHIAVEKLRRAQPLKTILFELIKTWGFVATQVDEVIGLLDSETGRQMFSEDYRILRNRNWLIVSKREEIHAGVVIATQPGVTVNSSVGRLKIEEREIVPGAWKPAMHRSVAQLDAALVVFPLVIRRWKAGDYFYPLGMQKKKKIARFFIDQKLSLLEKEQVWVVESGKRIVWIINQRIDDRFKIKPATSKIIQLSLETL